MSRAGIAIIVAVLCYGGALALWRDAVPPGLNNDAAEEALRGRHLFDTGQLRVMSTSPGIPQETLYLYGVAAISRLTGTSTLPIQLAAWMTAVACLAMIACATRRADPSIPAWVPLLIAGSSLWLLHYGRAGVRAISAPLCALAVGLLLDRAERSKRDAPALACGAALGLSVYAYTACRVLVIVVLVYAVSRLWRGDDGRSTLLRRYGLVLAAFLLVSIPNLLFAAAAPEAFFLRGSYVVRGGAGEAGRHLAASALLPFGYGERYRTLADTTHIFDGVSAGLTGAGIDPLSPLLAAAWLVGLVAAWPRRREPIVLYLLLLWPIATALLGFTGPSLTRLLIVLPTYLVVAALGVGALARRWPRLRPAIAVVLLLAMAAGMRGYFVDFAASDSARAYFSPAATPLGQRARALAASGRRVLCLVSKDANVVRWLTHDVADRVDVVEFYRRPFDVRDLSPVFRPDVVLIEKHPALAAAPGVLGVAAPVEDGAPFIELRP